MRAADLPPGSVVAQLSAVAYTRAVGVAPLSLWWRTGDHGLVQDEVIDRLLESGDAEVLRVGFGQRPTATAPAQPLPGETGSGVHPDTPTVSEASEGL